MAAWDWAMSRWRSPLKRWAGRWCRARSFPPCRSPVRSSLRRAMKRNVINISKPSAKAKRNLYEVTYSGVEVAAADVLARGEAAHAALDHALDVATVALAAEMVGGM